MGRVGELKVHLQAPPHLNMVMGVGIRGYDVGERRKGELQVGLNAKCTAHALVLSHEQVSKSVLHIYSRRECLCLTFLLATQPTCN